MILVDDAHATAQILREGMAQCNVKLPAVDFLERLGAKGSTYESLSVEPMDCDNSLSDSVRMLRSSWGLDNQLHIGQTVECRDSNEPWRKGVVTSTAPLKVKSAAWDFGASWDEVRALRDEAVPAELCVTPRCHWMPAGFAPCEDASSTNSHPKKQQPRGKDGAWTNLRSGMLDTPVEGLAPLVKKVDKLRKAEARKKTVKAESNSWMSIFDRVMNSTPARSLFGGPEEHQKRDSDRQSQKRLQSRQGEFHIRKQSWQGA
jgi:hypothetical protein